MNCQCYFDPEEDVIQWCPLHASAEKMRDALEKIRHGIATKLLSKDDIWDIVIEVLPKSF